MRHILVAVVRGNRVGGNWLMKWDEAKISHGTHMDWCTGGRSDLWAAWQLFPLDDDQKCDFKDRVGDWVGIELLYNSVKTEVKTVPVRVGDRDRRGVVGKATSGRRGLWAPDELQLEIGRSYRRNESGKATSGRRDLGALMSWGPDKMLIRCSKESHHPAEWASEPLVEH